MNIARIISFVTTVAGSFYVLMALSLLIHEVGGHLLAGALCGARNFSFSVTPGFSGWASSDYIRSDAAVRFVQYAGIGINAIVGFSALAFLRFRRPCLSNRRLIAFWIAVTESGHAIGYLLQGVLFGQGDGSELKRVLPSSARVLIVVCLVVLFLLVAAWALRTIAGFVRDHFRSTNKSQLLREHLVAFALPMAILILVAPGLPGRPFWTRVAFDGAIVLVLLLGSVWAVNVVAKVPLESDGSSISTASGVFWAVAAIALALLTGLSLAQGVQFSFA